MAEVPEGKEIDPEYNYDDEEEVNPMICLMFIGSMGRKESPGGKSTHKSESLSN